MANKLTLNMGDAAHAASLADGVSTNSKPPAPTEKVPLRRGKWTIEEEQFALRLIEEFRLGLLPLTDGTTLRTFLSKLLNCDPMRISKKFVGDNCIGKQVFRHASGEMNGYLSAERMEKSKRELAELERKFLDRLMSANTTATSSPRSAPKDNADTERKSKKAKISPKASQDDRAQYMTGNDSMTYVGVNDRDNNGGGSNMHGDMMYSSHQQAHSLNHPHHPHQHQHPYPLPPQHSVYSQHQHSSFLPPPMHPHDPHYYVGGGGGMGSSLDSRDRGASPSPSQFPQFAPHVSMPQHGGGAASEDWRHQLGCPPRPMGPFDSQLNWHQQYLPSQQFFDQHQSQLRSMGGGNGPGGTDQSEEGLLKAKGSFYKSIKSSSTSSLDLLGTLATSISRENLVSYGNSGDSSSGLNTLGSETPGTSGSNNVGGPTTLSRADHSASTVSSTSSSNNMKRNSKSIQDFWMLVEMGDLSRPEHEDLDLMNSTQDVDNAVFDIDDDKTHSQSQPPSHSTQSSLNSSSGNKGAGLTTGSVSTVTRCESAPSLTTSSNSNAVRTNPSGEVSSLNVGVSDTAQNIEVKDSSHDPAALQSLLSMASAEHLRMDSSTSAISPAPSHSHTPVHEPPVSEVKACSPSSSPIPNPMVEFA